MTPTHRRAILAAGLTALAGLAAAQPAPGPVDVVREVLAAFNHKDIAAVKARLAPEMSIIDDFGAYEWHGPGAFQAWLDDYLATAKTEGLTPGGQARPTLIRADVKGETAYVVMRSVLSYRQRGVLMAMPGREAFSLRRGQDGWKITGWAWAGDVPRAAGGGGKAGAASKS
jgi:ketosteroid isomerase-like protein